MSTNSRFETTDPTTLVPCMPFGFVADVLADLLGYLAIEVAARLPEGEILVVGDIMEPMRRANEILAVHGRPVCQMATVMIETYDDAKAKSN